MVVPIQANILVHVECLDKPEADLAGLVVLYQFAVHFEGSAA